MNIKEALLKEHTKINTMRIVNYIGDDKLYFKELMELFLTGEYRITQRAAWVMSFCAISHPELMKPYFKKILAKLREPNIHDALKRNVVKILSEIELPENFYGEIYEICFNYLRSMDENIAVKAHSMAVLEKICHKFPELKFELITTLEDMIPFGSAGIKARAKIILKKLKRVKQID
jgi:hypothetical protein